MRISDWSSDVCSSDLFYNVRPSTARMVGRAVLTAFDALAIEVHDPCTCGHIEIGILSSLRQVMLHPFDFTDCRVRCRYPCSIFLRSEERRVGKAFVRTCRSRGAPVH